MTLLVVVVASLTILSQSAVTIRFSVLTKSFSISGWPFATIQFSIVKKLRFQI
ncbi:hypothetical protein Nizo1840_2080 [Lactiplantibacillus plantarum]|nr:hypothetical protein FD10_GL001473 [Lactiplantibacillus argentoratensis DSM 16365]KZT81788.1 hypothetical protein Nizo1840_2080 [Lactiplantibacillus plantarum]KZU14405.1 hypothetical protein Nizo2264_1107 [Lactiplantibacillus plantarum]